VDTKGLSRPYLSDDVVIATCFMQASDMKQQSTRDFVHLPSPFFKSDIFFFW